MYPQFFNRVSNDPTVYYIFVVRGNFSAIPDKKEEAVWNDMSGRVRDQRPERNGHIRVLVLHVQHQDQHDAQMLI